MKICTSLKQSKQLMKLGIGISTADMHYWETYVETFGKESKQSNTPNIGFDSNFYYGTDNGKIYHYIPSWSLASLLEIIPGSELSKSVDDIGKWEASAWKDPDLELLMRVEGFDSPIDARYDMILKLRELKIL